MSQLIDYAQREIEQQGLTSPESDYDGELGKAVLELMQAFSKQEHSECSASMALHIFNRLCQFKPLSPLTGADDEWNEIGAEFGNAKNTLWQNKRCSSVFKDSTGRAWDIDAVVFVDRQTGDAFTSKDTQKDITFPYTPPDKPEMLYSDTKQPVQTLTLDEYQELAATTAIYPGQGTVNGMMYVSLGAAGECGEFCNQVKRILRDDGGTLTLQRREKLVKELGDELWYMAQRANELGASLSHIALLNLDKLLDRKNRDALHGEGDNR